MNKKAVPTVQSQGNRAMLIMRRVFAYNG